MERRRELVDWAKGQLASVAPAALPTGHDYSSPPVTRQPVLDFAAMRSQHAPLTVNRVLPPRSELRTDSVPAPHIEPPSVASPAVTPHSALANPHSPPSHSSTSRALQLHNRYLITESPEGMIVIDQHALHERVLYEQLREKVLSGALEMQQLLVPEPVDLSPAEAGLVKEHAASLAQVGLNTEPFGGDTILVTSYPAMLRHFRPAEVLRAMVDQLASGNRQLERRDLIDELLHMMSCKAAVKAGDPLTPDEVDALLEQRHLAQDTHHCPHGRPTMLVFTKEELDKQFKRT